MAHERASARLGGVACGQGVETTPTISAHTAALAAACARFHRVEPEAARDTTLESRERWHERHARGHYERMGWGGLRDAAARAEVASRLGMTPQLVTQAVGFEAQYFLGEAGALVEREACAQVMPLLEALVHHANAGASSCLWGVVCWASGERLRERAGGMSKRTCYRHLAKLRELGLVLEVQHAGNHSIKILIMPWLAALGLDALTQLEHLAHLGAWSSPERVEAIMSELRALDTLHSERARKLMGKLLRDGEDHQTRRPDHQIERTLRDTCDALARLSHQVRDEARALGLNNPARTPETPPRHGAKSTAAPPAQARVSDPRVTPSCHPLKREPHGYKENRTSSEPDRPPQIAQKIVLRPQPPTSQETPTLEPPPARVGRRERAGAPAHERPKPARRAAHGCDGDRAPRQPWWAAHREALPGRGMEQVVVELRGMLTGEHEHYPQLIQASDTVVQGRLMRGEVVTRQQDVPSAQVRATVALIAADLSTTHPDCHSLSAWLTGRLTSYLGRIVYQNPATLLHALRADASRTARDLEQPRQPVAPAPRPEQPARRAPARCASPEKTSRDKWSDRSYGAPKGLDPRLVSKASLRELRALVKDSPDDGVEPDAELLLSMEHTLGHKSLYQGHSHYTLSGLINALRPQHQHPDALLRALLELWTRAATEDPDDTPPARLARAVALHHDAPKHTTPPPRRDAPSPRTRQAAPHRQDARALSSTVRNDDDADADAAWFELAQCIECAGWPAHLGPRPDEHTLRAHIKPGWWRACPPNASTTLWLSLDILPNLRRARSRGDAFATISALSQEEQDKRM